MKLLSVVIAMLVVQTWAAPVWNVKNGFPTLTQPMRLKPSVSAEALVLADLGYDSYVTLTGLDIETRDIDTIVLTYRARGTGNRVGQLYFSSATDGNFRQYDQWRIPPLVADGKWHTMTLNAKAHLLDRQAWYGNGPVRRMRLDPTDSEGGTVEFSEIRLEHGAPVTVAPQVAKKAPKLPLPSAEITWNAANGFVGWNTTKNADITRTDDGLLIHATARDPMVFLEGLELNPYQCNTLIYTYKATGLEDSDGQLYYARDGESFTDDRKWRLPAPRKDGEWHTVKLTGTALVEAWSWFAEGPITALRLDPTDSAVDFTLKELKFTFTESGVMKTRKMPPLAKVTPKLDAPVWPAVQPYFRPFPKSKNAVETAYFRANMISSPADKFGLGSYTSFMMRRDISLKAAPAAAWLQFTGDDKAQAFINGDKVGEFDNWRELCVVDVTKYLRSGDNAWCFIYTNEDNAGGMIAELYVRYEDGTVDYFNTDKDFVTLPTPADGWLKPGFKTDGWQPVIVHDAPPARPWTTKLPYRDFANQGVQRMLSADISPKIVTAGQTAQVTYHIAGQRPVLPMTVTLLLQHKKDKLPEMVKDIVLPEGASTASLLPSDVLDKLIEEEFELTEANTKVLGDNEWQVSFPYEAPLYFNDMTCSLVLKATAFRDYPSVDFAIRRLPAVPGFEKKPVFRVVDHGGRPVFELNGKRIYPKWGGVQRGRRPDQQPIHNQGIIDICTLYVTYDKIWTSPYTICTYEYDRQAEAYRRNNPNAYFIVDMQCYPPKGWDKLHPDDMCLDGNGKVNKDSSRLNHTFASKTYLKDTEAYLQTTLSYLESCPYANRIIGYRITGGHTLEWLGWDPHPSTTLDFSPVAQAAFTDYARQHYPDLKDTVIPTMEEREALDGDEILWEPKRHLKSIAYADFYSDSIVDVMLPLCRKAKAIVGPDKVIGLYYGYTMTLGASGRAQMRAHYALRKVLDAKCIDFMISPHPYGLRNVGDIMGDMKPFSTIEKYGIVPVIEDDSRTFTCPSGIGYYQTINEAMTVNVLRRNMADTLCRNYQYYFYSLSGGTEFDFPAAERDLAIMREVGQHCLDRQVKRGAQVALVASEETIKVMPMLRKTANSAELRQAYGMDGKVITTPMGQALFAGDALSENYIRFARSGAAMDYVLAEDLKEHPGDYKLYVFLNCFKVDDAFRKTIETLKQRDCTLLWLYAPGYVGERENSLDKMRDLTGFEFTVVDGPLMPAVKLSDGRMMGTPTTRLMPMFAVTDKAATALGTYEDGSVGLAVKKTGRATSIYSGIWQFDVPFLQETLRRAGVHVFSDSSDPVDANEALFTLHARFPGHKRITLPKKTDVIDVFSKQLIGTHIDSFEYDAPLHETRFFYYGDDARQLLEKLRQ